MTDRGEALALFFLFALKLYNPTQIPLNDHRIKSNNLVHEHPLGNGIVKKYLFTKAECIVHFKECRAADIVGDAVFIKVKHQDGVVICDDVGAVFEHARFPCRMRRGIAVGVFGCGGVVTVWQGNGMSVCFERRLDCGNAAVKMLAADDTNIHGSGRYWIRTGDPSNVNAVL